MRKIGSLPNQQQADRFCDYLLTMQISATAEQEQDGEETRFPIWVKDEDRVGEAAAALDRFRAAPDSRDFDVSDQARKIRESQMQAARRHQKLQRKMPASVYFANRPIPCTIGIILIATLVSLTTKFERGAALDRDVLTSAVRSNLTEEEVRPSPELAARVFRSLSFVNIYDYVFSELEHGDADPLASIRRGQVWRVVTPMFLHGSPMHLMFNMLLFYFLGGALERLQGFGFMLGLTLFCQIISALVQSLMPEAIGGTPIAIGASGAGFGLFGYLWIRPLVVPSFPLRMPTINIVWILGFMILCMFPWFPVPIANGAHVGGLLSGIIVAVTLPRSWHV